jgi:hypothetical protein
MFRKSLPAFLLIGTLVSATGAALGQEIVHALTGKVTSIDPAARTMNVATNDGSGGYFHLPDNSHHTAMLFEKNVEALATPPTKFNKTGDQAVIFYFGGDSGRTSVGVEDLGSGPFQRLTGTVVKFDKHDHRIVVKDDKGADQTFQLSSKAVVDSPVGVTEADRLAVDKGDQVRIMATTQNGTPTVVFVRAL